MQLGWMIAAGIAALGLAGLGWGGWLVRRRPFALWAWAGRRTLAKAGMRRILVASPVGPQSAWIGGSGPVLALLHGVGHQAATWSRVAPALLGRFTVILPDLAEPPDAGRHFRLMQDAAVIQPLGLPMINRLANLKPVHPADHLVHLPEAELGHELPHLRRDHPHEINHMLRLARKPLGLLINFNVPLIKQGIKRLRL